MPESQPTRRRGVSVLGWVAVASFVPLSVMAVTTVTTWIGSGAGGSAVPGGAVVAGTSLPVEGEPGWPVTASGATSGASGGTSTGFGAASTPLPTDPPDGGTSVSGPAPHPTPTAGTDAPPVTAATLPAATPGTAPGESPEAEVVRLVNEQRTAAGCAPLAVDSRLAVAASAHASDMVTRHYFSHTTPDGKGAAARAAAAGYPGPVGENIAVGYSTARRVLAGWLASPGHRANLLNCAYKVTGVGFDPGTVSAQWGSGAWTELFGMS